MRPETALEPRLTKLDERVLAALPAQPPGLRLDAVAARAHCQHGCPATSAYTLDVRLVLRGLEHLGKARQRNGWWTR